MQEDRRDFRYVATPCFAPFTFISVATFHTYLCKRSQSCVASWTPIEHISGLALLYPLFDLIPLSHNQIPTSSHISHPPDSNARNVVTPSQCCFGAYSSLYIHCGAVLHFSSHIDGVAQGKYAVWGEGRL